MHSGGVVDDARSQIEVVRRGYDRLSCQYRADDDPDTYRPWLDHLLLRLRPRSAVLDLGCGNGVPVARRLTDAGHLVTDIDLSDHQVQRARRLVPAARFIRADLTTCELGVACFDAVVALYSLIHLPLHEQPLVINRAAAALVDGGVLVATVGWDAWTGTDDGWLGGDAEMWWSQADHATYRRWLEQASLRIETMEFIADGDSGHALFWATRTRADPGPPAAKK